MDAIAAALQAGKIKRIHMIGVGGSGMCPLCEIFARRGFAMSGSDMMQNDNTARLAELGVRIDRGHDASHVEGADLVVYSAAISPDNPERAAARAHMIDALERSQFLGLLTKQYKTPVCIAGTHGKTTVTSMLTHILLHTGKDPTAVIGGKLPSIGSNGCCGSSDLCVVEACEYVDSFLQLSSTYAVVTNIDNDHLEYFKTMENMCASFAKFMSSATKGVLVNGDDVLLRKTVESSHLSVPVRTFGLRAGNDDIAEEIVYSSPGRSQGICASFTLHEQRFALRVPGEHNVRNALAAASSAHLLGVTWGESADALRSFTGAGRRFEVYGNASGLDAVTVVDDYAHHPTELSVTLQACRGLVEHGQKIWCVFQPFTFSRTKLLMDDFAEALRIADHVVLTPIMGSRETNTFGVSSEQLAAKLDHAIVAQTFAEAVEYLRENVGSGDLIITMGGGDIYKVARMLVN